MVKKTVGLTRAKYLTTFVVKSVAIRSTIRNLDRAKRGKRVKKRKERTSIQEGFRYITYRSTHTLWPLLMGLNGSFSSKSD